MCLGTRAMWEFALMCFGQVGFIELATDEGYLEEYRRVAAFNRRYYIVVYCIILEYMVLYFSIL